MTQSNPYSVPASLLNTLHLQLIEPLHNPWELRSVANPNPWRMEMRHREVQCGARGHPAVLSRQQVNPIPVLSQRLCLSRSTYCICPGDSQGHGDGTRKSPGIECLQEAVVRGAWFLHSRVPRGLEAGGCLALFS